MSQNCVLSLDNVCVVRKALLVERPTVLDGLTLDEVCSALNFADGYH